MRSENMKSSAIEKRIVKIDQAVQAMNIAKKYLTNHDEIKAVVLELNRERQLLVNDLYRDDKQNYTTVREHLETLIDKPLDATMQKELLEYIKEVFGRQAATDGKTATGLNAWLKKLNVTCEWNTTPDSDWATLVLTGFKPFQN